MSDPILSLVVLAWNNIDLTKACAESLRRHTDVDYELIIVDNGSQDGTGEWASSAADISVLHEANLGFAAGMNAGLDAATGDYVAFINNDTSFPAAWASPIVKTFQEHPRCSGIVLPAVTAAGNPVTVREAPGQRRIVLTPFGEFPSGVVYVMPTATIRALGGWNEDYEKASAEDLDLAFTVWAHGLDIVLDERVLVEHMSQASVRHLADRKTLYRDNLTQFLDRWESHPLGTTPLLDTVRHEELYANQERARTAIIWIRRMLEAREAAGGPADGAPQRPKSGIRAWLRPRS